MNEIKDKTKIKVEDLLRSHPDGLTIKEMMDKTGLARHTLLARLHNLKGQDKIGVRQINMAKLHRWKHENEEKKEEKPDDVKVAEIKEEHIKEKPKVEEVAEETKISEGTEIQWVPQMSVNEDTIDAQHKTILEKIRELNEDIEPLLKLKNHVNFLKVYIGEHLFYEEEYLRKNKYPGLEDHKKIHKNFINYYQKSLKLIKSLNNKKSLEKELDKHVSEARKFLGDWWVNHINKEDQKYAKYISEKSPKKETDKKEELSKIETLGEFMWKDEMSVHEETIDKQHQSLLIQVNKLVIALSKGFDLRIIRETLDFLERYWKEHFTYEESYIEKIKFPGLEEHKKKHQEFVKFNTEFKQEFNTKYKAKNILGDDIKELAKKAHNFLGNWLIEHIIEADHEFCIFSGKCEGGEVVKTEPIAKETGEKKPIDLSKIKAEIQAELGGGKIGKKEAQIKEQREPIKQSVGEMNKKKKTPKEGFVYTGIDGFDSLMEQGIPTGAAVLVAGGAGSGKTIFCLQTLVNKAKAGAKCLYMSFEEREERLISHMKEFGWEADDLIKKGNLKIQRFNPFDITRNVDALLAKQKGELLIDIDPIIIPEDFKPDFIALDSLTAIASAFTGKEESYRVYIEQLFRFFEKIGATSFLITETEQIPKIFSKTGVEEFLADGVVVFYNLKHGNVRENAMEILKLRGAAHQKKIVAMQITGQGVVIYPEQEVFSEIEGTA